MGVGVLMGYAAYRNVPVFGPNGLLTEAIKTGKLQVIPPKPGTTPPAKPGAAHAATG